MPNAALYSTLKILGSPLLQGLYHHDVVGLENLPEGPYIVASNHLAFCDSIFIPLAMPRTVNFLAKSDYFTTPGVKGRAMAAFFRGVGQLPMDRSGGQKSQESLNAGAQVLKDGGIIGIYPEGTRSPDGRGYRPKVGVARLALETGVPVVPIGQIGTDLIQPSGSNRIRLRHDGKPIQVRTIIGKPIQVRTIIGKPLTFEEYTDGSDTSYRVQREIADRIGAEIRALSGQEYVDVYADRVKKLMADKNMSADEAVAHLQH